MVISVDAVKHDLDETHDPARTSWVESASGHPDFPIQNLPFGIFAPSGGTPRAGVAIGDEILDLSAIAQHLPARAAQVVTVPSLNALFGLAPADRRELRRALSALLSGPEGRAVAAPALHVASRCQVLLPAQIGDYTDFYVGIHHAMNVGKQFRPDQPLMPNYKYVPIGYHGRASSVRPSGIPVRRPNGQRKPPDAPAPSFGPARRLDYELELGIWVGAGNELGVPIPIDQANEHIVGLCLLNDWSARDLQAWEYQPLGPFLAKSFHTTVSPWVVTAEALAPFRVAQVPRPEGDPKPLEHLWNEADQATGALAIELTVAIRTKRMVLESAPAHVVARSAARHMYWTFAQILTHHASNGCDLRPGDLLGTGTLSADDPAGLGSLLETTRGGSVPVTFPNGETRTFLEDGDEVTLGATARREGFAPIGFGPCTGVVLPAP
ncbi:MAG: fumarylacetoacetase [Labilithrix sp.]|nr:fumarylacetoacetase [Labilithrix sp.]